MSLATKYKPIPFYVWYAENKEDLKKQFGPPSGVETQCCEECNGDGYVECDLGEEHVCEECDGEGRIELTEDEALYEYAGDTYQDQIARDRKVLERYEKEISNANSLLSMCDDDIMESRLH